MLFYNPRMGENSIVSELEETMGGKHHEHMTQENGPTQLFQLGKRQTDTVLNLQKELLDTYEEASRRGSAGSNRRWNCGQTWPPS